MASKARLRLFIIAGSPGSRAARCNLEAALGPLGIDPGEVMFVDVLDDPASALEAGVIVTPTLEISRDGARVLIAGRLADVDSIRGSLTHHVHIREMNGKSYRLKQAQGRSKDTAQD